MTYIEKTSLIADVISTGTHECPPHCEDFYHKTIDEQHVTVSVIPDNILEHIPTSEIVEIDCLNYHLSTSTEV